MISKIILENFFSFGEPTTIELNPDINILVGINGSGKSNFLKAIRLLKESIAGEGFEKIFLKDWSGFNSVCNFSKESKNDKKDYIKITYEFNKDSINSVIDNREFFYYENPVYEITIMRSGETGYYLKEKISEQRINNHEPSLVYLDMENSKGFITTRLKDIVKFGDPTEISFKSTETILRQISDPDRYYQLFTLKRAIENIAVYDYFDTTLKSSIRQAATFGTEKYLLSDGQNLMSILNWIKNQHSLEYEIIEEHIKNINPLFKDINFASIGSKLLLVLREHSLSKSISIEHISDGTLRYLILLAILCNPERGNMVCIDEPEIGLHPDMINSISKLMKTASKTSPFLESSTQLIIATHSPLLLNLFDLDEVLIFEKDLNNQTTVTTKSEDDFKDWGDNFLVGQLWLKGELGGKRW
ncbi:MAG: AAA family ATPase [Bacteroidia bacterium]